LFFTSYGVHLSILVSLPKHPYGTNKFKRAARSANVITRLEQFSYTRFKAVEIFKYKIKRVGTRILLLKIQNEKIQRFIILQLWISVWVSQYVSVGRSSPFDCVSGFDHCSSEQGLDELKFNFLPPTHPDRSSSLWSSITSEFWSFLKSLIYDLILIFTVLKRKTAGSKRRLLILMEQHRSYL